MHTSPIGEKEAQQARRRAEAVFNRQLSIVLFFLVGIITAGGGLYWLFQQSQATVTSGTVLYLAKARDSKGREQEHAVVQFLTGDGQVVTFRSPVPSSLRSAGSTVRVRYQPANPWGASIDGFWESWAMQLVLCGVGGLLLFACGTALWNEILKPRLKH